MATVLARERAFHALHEAEWMAVHAGRFVVVQGERLRGLFDSIEAPWPSAPPRSGFSRFWSAAWERSQPR